jgi:general secretion pathway protein H
LVELLIVLTVIGLMSTAVVLAMPDPRGSLRAEAERFAARAEAMQERAVIDARATAIRVTGAGYGFDIRERAEWRPLDRKPFVDYAWTEGTSAELPETMIRIVFDPTGVSEPATVRLSRGDEQASIDIGQDGRIRVAD